MRERENGVTEITGKRKIERRQRDEISKLEKGNRREKRAKERREKEVMVLTGKITNVGWTFLL